MKRFWLIAALALAPVAALATRGIHYDATWMGGGGGSGVLTGAGVGACADGTVMIDENGVTGCSSMTTTDPPLPLYINAHDCSSSPVQDPTCTAKNLVQFAGSDTKLITGITAATCNADGVDTITLVICGSVQLCTTVVLTQDSTPDSATDFNCDTTDLACTASIRTAVAAQTGIASAGCPEVTGACSTTTLGLQANRSTHAIGSITIAGGCGTANTGTDGKVVFHSGIDFGSTAAAVGMYTITAGDTDTGFAVNTGAGGSVFALVNGSGLNVSTGSGTLLNTVATIITGTLDQRGAISNSTGDVGVNDNLALTVGASTGALISYRHNPATVTTGAIAATVSGISENNTGASARADRTLPDAPAVGFVYRAFVNDADGVKIIANTGDTIYVAGVAGAADGYICSTTIGTSVECEAVSATVWVCDTNGTWTMDLGC